MKISRFPHPDYPREAGKRKNLFPRQKPAGLHSLVMSIYIEMRKARWDWGSKMGHDDEVGMSSLARD